MDRNEAILQLLADLRATINAQQSTIEEQSKIIESLSSPKVPDAPDA